MTEVSSTEFLQKNISPEEKLKAAQATTKSVYELTTFGDSKLFDIKAVGHHVNDLIFSDLTCKAARFHRQQQHLSGAQQDFLVLQAQISGEELIEMEHGIIRLLSGNIYLRDWSYQFDSLVHDMHIHSILIPRHRLKSSTVFNINNPILFWPCNEHKGKILWDLWSRLVQSFQYTDQALAEALCSGFIGFLDGLIDGSHTGGSIKHQPSLRSIELYIQQQLRGDINVDTLCKHFNISRATIFRLFKQHRGINSYIDKLRLNQCFSELKSSDPRKATVSLIAAGWGYTDASDFRRRFRRQFGISPSQILSNYQEISDYINPFSSGDNPSTELNNSFADWLQAATKAYSVSSV